MPSALTISLSLALSLGGLLLAFQAWRTRRNVGPLLVATLAMWTASTWLWSRRFGAEIGIPLAIETGALVAFGFILLRAERRTRRPERTRIAPEPAEADLAPNRWRGLARFAIGGPLAMLAAMAVAIVIAIGAPLQEQTRLILAGLIVPTLWAIFILYALLDQRLLRAAGTLGGVAAAGFAVSLLLKA